jgi:hypothetical protein
MMSYSLLIRINENITTSSIIDSINSISFEKYFNVSVVGTNSELVHDIIDEHICDKEFEITTTWHETDNDYSDYLDAIKLTRLQFEVDELLIQGDRY